MWMRAVSSARKKKSPTASAASPGCPVASADMEALTERHLAFLEKTARGLTGSAVQGDDLVQDTFLRAMTAYPQFEARSPTHALAQERAWLARIMKNLFIDRLRREKNGPGSLDDHPDPVAPPPPAKPAWRQWDVEDVEAAVEQLPDKLRETFELHYFQGLKLHQIADGLQISPNTVGTRLMRARRRIRTWLQAHPPESLPADSGQGSGDGDPNP